MTVVLITGACGPAGISLGHQLREMDDPNLVVIGADMSPRDDTPYSVLIALPPASAPDYIPALADAIAKFSVDVLIPTVSEELGLIAAVAPLVFEQVRVVVSSASSTYVAGDKLLTMLALERGGVPIPQFALGGAFTHASEAMGVLGGPVIVKPRVSRGGRNVYLYEDPDMEWGGFNDSWIVQQFAPGTEYCPQVFASSDSSRPHTIVVLEKTELAQGRVGNAQGVTRLHDDDAGDIRWLAQRTAQVLRLTGPIDMDVRRMPDGSAVVLEVNARFGAQSAHAPQLLNAVLDSTALVGL